MSKIPKTKNAPQPKAQEGQTVSLSAFLEIQIQGLDQFRANMVTAKNAAMMQEKRIADLETQLKPKT